MTDEELNSDSASTPLAPRPRRSWWRAFALTGVIFLSGIVVGATTASYALWFQNSHANRESRFREDRFIRHVERQFDLSQEQRQRIHAIVRQHHEALKQIRGETEPRIREVFESMRYEIESVLSLSDFQEWDRQFERMERRWLGPHPPPERFHRRGDRPLHRMPNLRERFQEIDQDHDDLVSRDEFTDINPDGRGFQRIDQDQDGMISLEEFLNAHRRRPDRRPPPEPDDPAEPESP
ncbi:MAG: EF-hand domain-containing protein [Candidatus Hydrogenedentes bacterium]|nr:EF-hand domain-containing protein [Candidatus Hydrogenedentota bacterium]